MLRGGGRVLLFSLCYWLGCFCGLDLSLLVYSLRWRMVFLKILCVMMESDILKSIRLHLVEQKNRLTAVCKAGGGGYVAVFCMCLQPTACRLEVKESSLLLSCSVAMLSPTCCRGDAKINTQWPPLISFHSFTSHPSFRPSPLSLCHLPRHLNFPPLHLPLSLSPHLSSAPFSSLHLLLWPPFSLSIFVRLSSISSFSLSLLSPRLLSFLLHPSPLWHIMYN